VGGFEKCKSNQENYYFVREHQTSKNLNRIRYKGFMCIGLYRCDRSDPSERTERTERTERSEWDVDSLLQAIIFIVWVSVCHVYRI